MTTNRRILVEVAFGHTPFTEPGPGDWVELTRPDNGKTRAKAAEWATGRDGELDPFPAGTATLTLWNRDRELDSDNPASTFAGQLVPLVPVRIRSQDLGTLAFDDEFCGYALGWDPVLSPKLTSDIEVKLIDLLGVIGGYRLPGVFEAAVLDLDPVHYWPLTDSGCLDLGSGRRPGVPQEGPSFSGEPLFPGAGPSVEVDGRQRIDISRSQLLYDSFHCTVIAMFDTSAAVAVDQVRPIYFYGDGNSPAIDLHTLHIRSDGVLVHSYVQNHVGSSILSQFPVNDGRPHLAIVQSDLPGTDYGVAIDSATLYQDFVAAGGQSGAGAAIGGAPYAPAGYDDNNFEGLIGHVAIFDRVFTQPEREALLAAVDGLESTRTDEQIAWALDRLGIPASMRNLDQGAVIMGAADASGREAIEWLRDVEATEQGELYCDHRDGGKIRFRSRYARFLDTTSTVSQATFTDAEGADPDVDICYTDDGLDIAGSSRDGVINQVTVAWAGGETVVEDAASVAANGPRPRQVDTAATTAPQAESIGSWILERYRSPRTRIRGVQPGRRTTYSRHDKVHALEIGQRVTFEVTPLHVGAQTEDDLFIDGIDNAVHGVEWTTAFRLTPADTFVPWIWGVSEWGVDAMWG